MNIKLAEQSDAENLIPFWEQLDNQTQYLLFEPNERVNDLEQYQHQLAKNGQHKRQVLFVAATPEHTIAGFMLGFSGMVRRNEHNLTLVLGVLEAYQRQCLTTALFARLEHWAREQGFCRLDLSVMEPNTQAIALYKKWGFEQEGLKKASIRLNGRFIDELTMAKWIGHDLSSP